MSTRPVLSVAQVQPVRVGHHSWFSHDFDCLPDRGPAASSHPSPRRPGLSCPPWRWPSSRPVFCLGRVALTTWREFPPNGLLERVKGLRVRRRCFIRSTRLSASAPSSAHTTSRRLTQIQTADWHASRATGHLDTPCIRTRHSATSAVCCDGGYADDDRPAVLLLPAGTVRPTATGWCPASRCSFVHDDSSSTTYVIPPYITHITLFVDIAQGRGQAPAMS